MQTNPAVELNKNTKWSENPWNQSGNRHYPSVCVNPAHTLQSFKTCVWFSCPLGIWTYPRSFHFWLPLLKT